MASKLYLGGEEFLNRMGRIAQTGEDQNIPHYQMMPAKPDLTKILIQVADTYGKNESEILKPRTRQNQARDVAIYILRKSGFNSAEIGLKMGIAPSAVRNRWNRLKKKIPGDSSLVQQILKCQMSA